MITILHTVYFLQNNITVPVKNRNKGGEQPSRAKDSAMLILIVNFSVNFCYFSYKNLKQDYHSRSPRPNDKAIDPTF